MCPLMLEATGFRAQMLTKVLSNLQISIRHVHCRYEDDIHGDVPFALGFTLHSLEAKSTDEDWNETVGTIFDKIYKV